MMMMKGRGVAIFVMVMEMAVLSLALGQTYLAMECNQSCLKGCPKGLPSQYCEDHCKIECTKINPNSCVEDCVSDCQDDYSSYPSQQCYPFCEEICGQRRLTSDQNGNHYCNLGCVAAKCTTLIRSTPFPKDQVAATEAVKACFSACSDVCSTTT